MNRPPLMFRGDHLASGEAQTRLGFDNRHALVVGGEAAAEIDREDGLLDCDERHALQRREHPEDARQVEHDVYRQEGTLHSGRTISLTDQPLDAQHIDARAAQDHEREEQGGAPTLHQGDRPAPDVLAVMSRCRVEPAIAHVGVTPRLIGVRVMGAVLRDPPAEAHPDQHVADRKPEQPVGPAGAKDLLVPGVMTDEAQLGEHQSKKGGDAERGPGVAEQHQPGEPGAERCNGQRDLEAVVAEAAVEQPRLSNAEREDAEVL